MNVPATLRDPVTAGGAQVMPISDTSNLPEMLRHDDITLHVPVASPPQAATLVHVLELPPTPGAPPLLLDPPPGLPPPAAPPTAELLEQPMVAIGEISSKTPRTPTKPFRIGLTNLLSRERQYCYGIVGAELRTGKPKFTL